MVLPTSATVLKRQRQCVRQHPTVMELQRKAMFAGDNIEYRTVQKLHCVTGTIGNALICGLTHWTGRVRQVRLVLIDGAMIIKYCSQ